VLPQFWVCKSFFEKSIIFDLIRAHKKYFLGKDKRKKARSRYSFVPGISKVCNGKWSFSEDV
jgi:hypothetical protein